MAAPPRRAPPSGSARTGYPVASPNAAMAAGRSWVCSSRPEITTPRGARATISATPESASGASCATGAMRASNGHRAAGDLGVAEREERGGALVDVGERLDPRLARERPDERRGPRAGGGARRPHAAAGQLVDKRAQEDVHAPKRMVPARVGRGRAA